MRWSCAVFLASAVLFPGCSDNTGSTSTTPKEREVAATLTVVNLSGVPSIIASGRIPLDDASPIQYFLALDGTVLYGDYNDGLLPIKPPNSKIRFGHAWRSVPIEGLDEGLRTKALDATNKQDRATLEEVAKELNGHVSFFYETRKEAYGE